MPTRSPARLAAAMAALGGAALGATLGRLASRRLRPAGRVVGAAACGLIGAVAGMVVGDTATTEVRPLTGDEQREARRVFGNNLDYRRVRVGESAIMGIGNYARTPFETVYFPPGAQASPTFMPWLIHELAHVWQTQHGTSVSVKVWWALHAIVGNPYDYGGPATLREAARQGKHLVDFNTEQQGDICRDYYTALVRETDTSAFDPFIRDVQGLPRCQQTQQPASSAALPATRTAQIGHNGHA